MGAVSAMALLAFGEFCHQFINFREKNMETIRSIVVPRQKLMSSTHSLNFLTTTLNTATEDFCVLERHLPGFSKVKVYSQGYH